MRSQNSTWAAGIVVSADIRSAEAVVVLAWTGPEAAFVIAEHRFDDSVCASVHASTCPASTTSRPLTMVDRTRPRSSTPWNALLVPAVASEDVDTVKLS